MTFAASRFMFRSPVSVAANEGICFSAHSRLLVESCLDPNRPGTYPKRIHPRADAAETGRWHPPFAARIYTTARANKRKMDDLLISMNWATSNRWIPAVSGCTSLMKK